MNKRSMGLDSECDVTIDVALPANRDAAPAITRLRESLIAEHLGVETADVTREFARTGSLIATIEVLQGDGRPLALLDAVSPGPLHDFFASTELLNPTRSDAMFEAFAQRGRKKRGICVTR